MFKLIRVVITAGVMVCAGGFAAHRFDTHQQAVLEDMMKTTAVTPAYMLDEAALAGVVQSAINANPRLNLSVSITDLQTGKQYHYGESDSYVAASVAKLLTATLYLRQAEAGKTNLSQQIAASTAQIQLEKMIVESDNAAWHALNSILTHQALRDYAASLGISGYDPETNTLTSDSIALILAKLAQGKLLNNANTKLLLGYLQRADMRGYIAAGAPTGAIVYHKVGYLSDRLHDAAIIKKGNRSFVLVIFSKTTGAYDFTKGATVFAGLTSSVSSVFFGS